MDAHEDELDLTAAAGDDPIPGSTPIPEPPPLPVASPVSGLYDGPATPVRLGSAPVGTRPIRREVIRLDVDGRYPQMTVSGTIVGALVSRIHWVARLRRIAPNRYQGSIWYRDGAGASFPYTTVDVTATPSSFPAERRVKIVFAGGGAAKRTVEYSFTSGYFRTVNFEFDVQSGEVLDTAIETCAHPIRPAGLPCESLSIQTVYRRVGCQVTTNPPSIVGAAPGGTWSDMEMHDAMQVHWSRFANTAQWAMWVFFAALHESGTSLGGIMYDDIGPNHRQGTALFLDSFIANPPFGDPSPDAWRDRMRFWTAVHEMGHAFNLAHSWQKAGGVGWVPLANEPEARSFMNYPYNVAGGQNAFWSTFQYRFTDPELLFIRHAPERFVQMGNADWFDHHGFQEAAIEEGIGFALELRVNREQPRYEFMEPVWIELKLTNTSEQPQLVDANALDADALTIVLKKDRAAARQLVPFRQKCVEPVTKVLQPGESLYGTVLVSAGLNGWDVAEPGRYTIQVAAHAAGQDVVSQPLELRIAPPVSREEEYLAGDLFTQDPARTLVFGGTKALGGANDVLAEIVERLPERRIAIHARVALGGPMTIDYKQLAPKGDALGFALAKAKPEEATTYLEPALVDHARTAADTFGHIRYRGIAERTAKRLAEAGAEADAARTIDSLIDTLATRTVGGRPVKAEVIEELKETRAELTADAKPKGKAKAKAKTSP